ncbi:ribonuclease T2 family protein [Roseibium salinum]|uniref:Ribonuclease T n=1 Tax=Roseibium salinum TaxID=1604349 RepID=A0ABT3QXJ1_9HYPH|nr:ribonuclease T [Roseibium sp. DSM 29163]MCX2721663.1 ribonuclease T [Roseibium sp. DSM 29163]
MALASRAWRLAVGLLMSVFSAPVLADQPGDFDFYVLSLSWSPTYCKQEGEDASRYQCGVHEPFRFIVHGLWPQYERGYPESCEGPPQRIDRQIAVDMEDIMPSHGLVFHQWRKHGTCSGLDPQDYFSLTRKAFEKIAIPGVFSALETRGKASPATVERAFRLANPGLEDDAMAVSCVDGELEEVRICLTRDLAFRSCPSVDRAACRAASLAVPPPVAR